MAPGIISEVLVPAGQGRSIEVKEGQLFHLIDVEGTQVGDFVAFRRSDMREAVSPSHTRSVLGRITLGAGDRLITNGRRPLMKIVHDDVGAHDLLWAACDGLRYSVDFGLENHANCRDNLVSALGPYGIESWRLPDPINFFMNTPVGAGGAFETYPAASKPGDRVIMRCLDDVIIAVSSCPQDQTPINGGKITPLLMQVTEGPCG